MLAAHRGTTLDTFMLDHIHTSVLSSLKQNWDNMGKEKMHSLR